MRCLFATIPFLWASLAVAAEPTARESLKPFHDLIGSWRGTGVPEGTRAEREAGFWSETISWAWQFRNEDAWLAATFDKGKHFSSAELRPLAKNRYRLTVKTVDQKTLTFEGELSDRRLTIERTDERSKESQRLVIRMLHANRITYGYEVKPDGKAQWTKKYLVGATKDGEPFATTGGGPECIVSGGQGTMTVSYQGKTYYVCCSGCRDEFKANPEKYIKEFEAKKRK